MEDFILKVILELIGLASIIFAAIMYCAIWYLLDLPLWTVNIIGMLILGTIYMVHKTIKEF